MDPLFVTVSEKCSKITTTSYSTSFSLGIRFLNKKFHNPIYSIYGFVRFADEIVDSFHDYDKHSLLEKFKHDAYEAIDQKISLNPILNSFQRVVHEYGIERELIDAFLKSMEMDLYKQNYNRRLYEQYIFGSAEVVGLMCLRVFCEKDSAVYESLKPAAMRLGSAFQKINFLRDLKADHDYLGRTYFPGVDLQNLSAQDKLLIEREIEIDLQSALEGIRRLPTSSRKGVYLAYYYYRALFRKIKQTHPKGVMNKRIRIPNFQKMLLMITSALRHELNIL